MKREKEMKTMKEQMEQYKIDAGIHNEKLLQRQLLLINHYCLTVVNVAEEKEMLEKQKEILEQEIEKIKRKSGKA